MTNEPSELDLPKWVERVFDRYKTCELTTLSKKRRPSTVPVTAFFDAQRQDFFITTSVALPQKAYNVRRDPNVSLLYAYPVGSGMDSPTPVILLQGKATVEDDLVANRVVMEEVIETMDSPSLAEVWQSRVWRWWYKYYFIRIFLRVRPERVIAWEEGNLAQDPIVLEVPNLRAASPLTDPVEPGPLVAIGRRGRKRLREIDHGVLTIREPATGRFASYPSTCNRASPDGVVELSLPPGLVRASRDSYAASLCFHRHSEKISAVAQQTCLGTARVRDSGSVDFRTEWQMGYAAPEGLIMKFFLGWMTRKSGPKYFMNRLGPTPDMIPGPRHDA